LKQHVYKAIQSVLLDNI